MKLLLRTILGPRPTIIACADTACLAEKPPLLPSRA
jgi:hypothetical protein